MLTVSHDVVSVESDLAAGRVACPGCGGRLRPWGSARLRAIRHGVGSELVELEHRPRRGRCSGCRATHVLLDVVLAARRTDSAGVIAAGIEAKIASGWGHRKIAAWCGRPASTVRGWLRSFAAAAAHRSLRSSREVAPVYLETAHRIEALLLCHFLAMLTEALLEREIRTSMSNQSLTGIPLYPELRSCPAPSAPRVLEIFDDVQRHQLIDDDGQIVQTFQPQLTPLQEQVLDLLHIPTSIYTSAE